MLFVRFVFDSQAGYIVLLYKLSMTDALVDLRGHEIFNEGVLEERAILKSVQLDFYEELKTSFSGKKTSLPFIINSLPSVPQVCENESFQVMVIGGSVFKKAIGKRRKTGTSFSKKAQEALPVLRTKEDFISLVERNLDPQVRVVALNFAYPMNPVFDNGKLDGVLMSGTKEHAFDGFVGECVGQYLEKYFYRKYKRKILFTVANDTVCLLLSGLGSASWENLAGGVVGTGINFAYFLGPQEVVNLESGNFDKFPISPEALEIDLNSTIMGKALFEKETAGSYLYQHFNSILTKQRLNHPKITSTWELKKLALLDIPLVSPIAKDLIRKSAGLVASLIAGIVLFKEQDMTFVMEGSFFWEEDIYREYVESFLQVLVPDRKVTFVHVPDSPFAGAAKLAG
jgi:hexokinase